MEDLTIQSNGKAAHVFAFVKFAMGILMTVMIFAFESSGQYRFAWDKVYGSGDGEQRSFVMNSEDGGYITCIASYKTFTKDTPSGPVDVSSQFWIQKTDINGDIVWDKNFGSDGPDFPTCVLKVPGGYLIGGETNGESFDRARAHRGGIDYWIIKIDEMGNLMWENSFGGNRDDRLKAIVANHFVYHLIGDSDSDRGGDKSGPANASGRSVWEITVDQSDGRWNDENTFNYNNIRSVSSAALSPRFAIYVVANYRDRSSRSRIALMGVSASGIFLMRTYDGENDLSNGVIEKTTDGYLIASIIRGTSSHGSSSDYCAIKIDNDGRLLWKRNYGTSATEELTSLIYDGDFFVLGGLSNGNTEMDKSEDSRGTFDYWLLAIDKDGNPLFDHTFGGDHEDYLTSMTMKEGILVATGRSASGATGDKSHPSIGREYGSDIWTVKLISGLPEVDLPLYWDWIMFPVPCDIQFEIFWKARDNYRPDHILPGKYYFTLYDKNDKVVVKQEIKDIKTTIKTANLPSGDYVGHIANEKQQIEKAAHIPVRH